MSPPPDAATMSEAARLYAARHSGEWSEADEGRLAEWLALDPTHRQAFARLENVWAAAGDLVGRVDYAAGDRRHTWRRLAALAVAAALVAALFLPVRTLWERAPDGATLLLETTRGEARAFTLADGSRAELDAGSAVAVVIGQGRRELRLLRGEMLLTVAPDAARPLVVHAGPGTITDLGTRFDVESLAAGVRVAVAEGRVDLTVPGGRAVLAAGERGGYDARGELEPVQPSSGGRIGWQDGRRHFDAEPLGLVVERLKRYHATHIELAEPQLALLPVSGTFRLDDLPLLLRTLEAALPLTVRRIDADHVEIRPRDVAR